MKKLLIIMLLFLTSCSVELRPVPSNYYYNYPHPRRYYYYPYYTPPPSYYFYYKPTPKPTPRPPRKGHYGPRK